MFSENCDTFGTLSTPMNKMKWKWLNRDPVISPLCSNFNNTDLIEISNIEIDGEIDRIRIKAENDGPMEIY